MLRWLLQLGVGELTKADGVTARSCRVEEKITLKEVDGQTIQEFETKIIAKDGTITRV
ncbi:hypothetical protein Tco_0661680, partial [Tanacetum coccineum]